MKGVLLTILSLSVSGSLLGVLLLALRPLIRHRLPKVIFYYAWLLVLFRLMVPVGYGVPLPELPRPEPDMTQQQGTLLLQTDPMEQEHGPAGAAVPERDTAEPDWNAEAPEPVFSFSDMLFFLWLVGMAGSLGWHIAAYTVFFHKLKQSFAPPRTEELALFERLRGKTRVRLACSSRVDTPMLMGLLHPVIVLPRNGLEFSEMEGAAVLRHELTHCKRGDLFYKWLVVLVTAFHWFNPLVYWLGRQIALDCELSCDEAVLSALMPEERMGYGELLLALAARRRLPAGVTATTLCEEKRQLKARLQGILRYRKPTRAALCLTLILVLGLACCACGVLDLTGQTASQVLPTPAGEAGEEDPYEAILTRYEEALALRQPDDYPDLPNAMTNPYWAWGDTDSLLDRTGYAQMDLNGDGVEELLLGWIGGEFWNLDEGYVFAVYTLVDGQPVLAVEGWERSLYVVGTDGFLYHQGSSGAGRTEWYKYRFDPKMEGYLEMVERVSEPEDGQDAVTVGEGWMASGMSIACTPFAPPPEKESAYQDVLLGNAPFLYWAEDAEEPESKSISEVPALFSPDSPYAEIYQFAVLDLDADGTEEVVLWITDVGNDMGGYLILHKKDGVVYGFPSHWRTFWDLKTDGTFTYSYSAGFEDGVAVIRFTETGYEMDRLIRGMGEQAVFHTFEVNHQPVSQMEYEAAWEAQKQKPDAQWHAMTLDNIEKLL